MKNYSKIAILMATYNGGEYLSEQIDSLLKQNYQDFTIFVHDDGSEDSTLAILDEYVKRFPRKFYILRDSIRHRGAGESFMWLLENVDSEYYMFCDQDDVWLPNKIQLSFNKILDAEKIHKKLPILIHSDLIICDNDLNIIHNSLWQYRNFKVELSQNKEYIGIGNVVTGCTMIINNAAKENVFPYNGKYMHDYWIAMHCAKYGIIDNIKDKTILYRQHQDNTVGAGRKYSKLKFNVLGFYRGGSEEFQRVKYIAGFGMRKWIWYRFLYLLARHLR